MFGQNYEYLVLILWSLKYIRGAAIFLPAVAPAAAARPLAAASKGRGRAAAACVIMASHPPKLSRAQRVLPCDAALAEVAKNPSVSEIYLGRRSLVYISDLTRYKQLEALWLNDNSLTALHGFDCNPTLQAVYAHNNSIYTLAGSLQNLKYLRSLSLYNNNLRDLKATLPYIRHLQYLVALDLFGNPLANEPNYRLLVAWTFPSLHVLDRHEITDDERLAAVKKFGQVSQDLVAFGKRTTKWQNPPPIPLAALSATASDMYAPASSPPTVAFCNNLSMYKELERVRARVEAEEAAKGAGQAAAAAEEEEEKEKERRLAPESKHVRNDYISVMKWSNPAVELAAGASSAQGQHELAQATAAYASVASASGLPSAAPALALDHAKYAQCVPAQFIDLFVLLPLPFFLHFIAASFLLAFYCRFLSSCILLPLPFFLCYCHLLCMSRGYVPMRERRRTAR
jgi:hypothetical protein